MLILFQYPLKYFSLWFSWQLTHWGQVTHICVGNLTIIGSDNGLLPGQGQAITWTNVGILLIGLLGINFSEMLIKIHTFSFKKMHLKMSSGKRQPFCLGLNVLIKISTHVWILKGIDETVNKQLLDPCYMGHGIFWRNMVVNMFPYVPCQLMPWSLTWPGHQ